MFAQLMNFISLKIKLPIEEKGSPFVQTELIAREELVDAPSLIALIASILLVILVKYRNTHVFTVTFGLFIRQMNFESTIKENWPLFSLNAWLLIFNFILNLSLSLYIYEYIQGSIGNWEAFLKCFVFASFFLMIAFFSMIFVNFLTGTNRATYLPLQITWVLPQFTGIALLCLNMGSLLNQSFQNVLFYFVAGLLLWISFARLFRSGVYLYNQRIEWYYILLYLCTLEIIPLLLLGWFFFN